jgi:Phosphatidylinositolglycan class N (PIG-N)
VALSGITAIYALPRYFEGSLLKVVRGKPIKTVYDTRTIWIQVLYTKKIAIIILSVVVLVDTSRSLTAKEGLPLLNSILSWGILATSLLIPVMDGVTGGHHFMHRLVVIYLAFAPVFILLSIRYYEINIQFRSYVLLFLLHDCVCMDITREIAILFRDKSI